MGYGIGGGALTVHLEEADAHLVRSTCKKEAAPTRQCLHHAQQILLLLLTCTLISYLPRRSSTTSLPTSALSGGSNAVNTLVSASEEPFLQRLVRLYSLQKTRLP